MTQHLHSTKSLYAFLALFHMQCTCMGHMCNQKILPDTSEVLIYRKNLRPKIPTWKRNLRTKKRNNALFFYVFLNFFFIFLFFFVVFLIRVLMDGRVGIYQQYKNSCQLSLFEMPVANFMCNFSSNFRETSVFPHGWSSCASCPSKKNIGHESNRNIRDTRLDSRGVAAGFITARGGRCWWRILQRPGKTFHTFSKENIEKPCKNYQNAILHIAIFRKETPNYGPLKSQRKNKSQVLGPHSSYCKMLWYQVATIIFTNKNSQCALALLCDLFLATGG